MKIVDKLSNVINAPWLLNSQVVIQEGQRLLNYGSNKELIYGNEVKRSFYSNNYIFLIKEKKILIVDGKLSIKSELNIKNAEGISVFDDKNYAVWFENEDGDEYFDLYFDNTFIGRGDSFYGKFLDRRYCYRFKKRRELDSFRLTNLLDSQTYFEFRCIENEEIYSEIKLYKDVILFYTKEKDKESYDSKFWINVVDAEKGNLIHKMEVLHYDACFDEETGRFISIQGTNQNNEVIKIYEIVDIKTGKVERGGFDYDGEMFAVGTAVQFYNEGKLYFVDNVYSYEEQKRKSPKIGCFDIETKQIDFFEPLEEAEGYSINSLVVSDGKIYVKTNNNVLYVLQ